MAAEPKKPAANEGDAKKWLTILVPAAGVAALVVVIIVMSSGADPAAPTGKDKAGGAAAASTGPVDTTKLTDGTDPNAEDAGLKDIGGGLKVRDLKEGTGAFCPPGATVVAHYTGWLTTGKVFDSSRTKGEPIEFPLSGVVKGWQEGIPGMKVGGVRKLVIPSDMAYGARGRPGIPPNSTLVFEVELVSIK